MELWTSFIAAATAVASLLLILAKLRKTLRDTPPAQPRPAPPAGSRRWLLGLVVDTASLEIHEGTLFTDTEPFVETGAEILPGPQGSVYVVTNRNIAQLSLA